MGTTSYGAPDFATSQSRVPIVDIATSVLNEPLFVYGDFRDPANYSISLSPGGTESNPFSAGVATLSQGKSIDVVIRLSSITDYGLELGPGLRRVDLQDVGPSEQYVSRPSVSMAPTRGRVYLIGRISSSQSGLTLKLQVKERQLVRSGAYVRAVLPAIDSSAGLNQVPQGSLEDVRDSLQAAGRIATIDTLPPTPKRISQYVLSHLHLSNWIRNSIYLLFSRCRSPRPLWLGRSVSGLFRALSLEMQGGNVKPNENRSSPGLRWLRNRIADHPTWARTVVWTRRL